MGAVARMSISKIAAGATDTPIEPTQTDARRKKGEATREKILSVATRLLAEQGYNGVSLRQVCTEAEVNLALMSYHFGTKEKLLLAIFERGTRLINEERARNIESLEESTASGATADLEAILEAFVDPTMKATSPANPDDLNFLRLSGRMASDPTPEVRHVISKVYDHVALRFVRLLRAACKHLDDREFFMRLVFFYGAMLYTRADTGRVNSIAEQMSVSIGPLSGIEASHLMIPFLAAGFRAPATPHATASKSAASRKKR